MIITDDDIAGKLHVLQLSDSFFPTGLFATSNGLETLFFDKKVTTASELLEFNKITIKQQMGPGDCVVLANAYDYADASDYENIKELDAVCCAMKAIKEVRKASVRSGNQLVRCVKEFLNDDKVLNWYSDSLQNKKITGVYPVSFAVCCKSMKISKENALVMFLYGFVVSNVGASLRLGMIQHFEGQNIIHQLKPLITKTVNDNINSSISEIWQFLPQIEIFQMRHEKTDSKMFIT